MIVCKGAGLCYVANPKTGTRSVYRWLREQFGGVMVQDHLRVIPSRVLLTPGIVFWTTVRNPYDRIASAWWSTTMRAEDRYRHRESLDRLYGGHGLLEYVRWLLDDPAGGRGVTRGHFWSRSNQTTFLALARPHLALVLRTEDLPDVLRRLPGACRLKVNRFPRENVSSDRPPTAELMTPDVVELVNEWAGPDFDEFGYQRIEPSAARSGGDAPNQDVRRT